MRIVLYNSDGEEIKEMPFGKETNFDSVTESPEALAEFIGSVLDCCSDECGECKHCPLGKNCSAIKDFKQIALEWLKQESDIE